MKKLFVFKPDHCLDVITNSSSELFVLKGSTKEYVEEMIKNVYPDYLREYSEIKSSKELDVDEVSTYLTYWWYYKQDEEMHVNGCSIYGVKSDYVPKNPFKNFSFDEVFCICSWDAKRYHLRYEFVTEKNKDELLEEIDPNGDMFFLFSHGDNPNWEMQEKLMRIGERYHLG